MMATLVLITHQEERLLFWNVLGETNLSRKGPGKLVDTVRRVYAHVGIWEFIVFKRESTRVVVVCEKERKGGGVV